MKPRNHWYIFSYKNNLSQITSFSCYTSTKLRQLFYSNIAHSTVKSTVKGNICIYYNLVIKVQCIIPMFKNTFSLSGKVKSVIEQWTFFILKSFRSNFIQCTIGHPLYHILWRAMLKTWLNSISRLSFFESPHVPSPPHLERSATGRTASTNTSSGSRPDSKACPTRTRSQKLSKRSPRPATGRVKWARLWRVRPRGSPLIFTYQRRRGRAQPAVWPCGVAAAASGGLVTARRRPPRR